MNLIHSYIEAINGKKFIVFRLTSFGEIYEWSVLEYVKNYFYII